MTTENTANVSSSGLQIFNSTTGAFSGADASAKGDLLVYDGSAYTFLTLGANEKVLTLDSSEATGFIWNDLPFTGDWVLIGSETASSSATIDFTNLDTSTYASFHVRAVNIHPATDNVSLQTLMSIDNGVSFISSGYSYVYRIFDVGSGTINDGHSTSASAIETSEAIGNAGGEGIAGWFWLLPSGDPTQTRHSIEWQLYSQDTGNVLNGFWGGAINSTTSAIDALRFQFSSGNIEVGTFYLYGLNAS